MNAEDIERVRKDGYAFVDEVLEGAISMDAERTRFRNALLEIATGEYERGEVQEIARDALKRVPRAEN